MQCRPLALGHTRHPMEQDRGLLLKLGVKIPIFVLEPFFCAGVFLFALANKSSKQSLLPLNDPLLAKCLGHKNI